MKKHAFLYPLLTLCITAVIFSGCDTDGETVPGQMNFDLLSGKWSITKQVDKVYDNGVLIEEQTVETDMNLNTFEVLGGGKAQIINVFNSMWAEADYQINKAEGTMNIKFIFGKDDIDITLKILSLSENAAVLQEEGLYDGKPRLSTITMAKNTGNEPVVTKAQLVGTWQITEFKRFENSVLQDDEEDNPTGATLVFRNDNSGTMFMGDNEMDLEWIFIDGSNFAMMGEFSEFPVLLNIRAFDSSAGVLSLVEGQYQYEEEGVILHSTQIKITSVPD